MQLDIVALPLDAENDTEPSLDLHLYVNGELFQNLQSNSEGSIKESYVLSDVGSEHLIIKIEDVVHWVQSKIKSVMIEEWIEVSHVDEKADTISQQKQEIIDFVSKNWRYLSDPKCKEYIDDYDVVLAAVRQNGLAIQFASGILKLNYDLCMEAVKQNGLALKVVADAVKDIPEICVEAINNNILAYDLCSDITLTDEQVLEAVFNFCFSRKTGLSNLKKLPKEEKDTFESLLYPWYYLHFATTQHRFLKNNRALVLHLIKDTPSLSFIIPYVSNDLLSDETFIQQALYAVSQRNDYVSGDIHMQKAIMDSAKKLLISRWS